MKVRVKFNGQSHRIDLGTPSASHLTLRDLLQAVANTLHLETSDFNLSLNRHDFLEGDDKLLSDLGIVAGDLIYVTRTEEIENNPSRQDAPQRPQPVILSSLSANEASSNLNNLAQPMNEDNEHPSDDTSARTAALEERMGTSEARSPPNSRSNEAFDVEKNQSDPTVNRYLVEPLVVRESTAQQVPALLSQLYTSSDWSNNSEALWVVLHTLMIESGFTPTGHGEHTTMPDGWKQPGFFSCNYDYMVTANVVLQCMVIGVTIGSSISVHGLAKGDNGFKTESFQLKATHFVRTLSSDASSSYRALDHLSRQFKDVICLPLTNHLTRSAGMGDEQGLMALPCELRVRLLTYLDVRSICRLGAICSHWNAIYKDYNIWRRLYLKHFQAPLDCSLGRNWYEMYKEKFKAQKEEEEERERRSLLFTEDIYHPRPFPVPPMFGHGTGREPFFPHIVGGDYDLNPEFSAGIPNPMGQQFGARPRLGPRLPSSGIPTLPGRPSRGRTNLTGNPFNYF